MARLVRQAVGEGREKGALFYSAPDPFAAIEGAPDAATQVAYAVPMLALPMAGELAARQGSVKAGAGECLFAPRVDALDFGAADVTLLVRAA